MSGPGDTSAGPELSEAEHRFDRARKAIGRVAAPVALASMLLAPLPLAREAHVMAAVAVFTVILWVTEAIPLWAAALLGPAAAVALGAATAESAILPFLDRLIFLFLGGFILAEAVAARGFDRRAALWMLSRGFVAGSPSRAMIAVALVTFVFSMWISNTATAAMMIPIALGLCTTIRRSVLADGTPSDPVAFERKQRSFDEGMLITLAYAASLGGFVTPIGTAPNIIALGELRERLHVHLDFLQWISFALPIAVASLAVMLTLAYFRFPPPRRHVSGMGEHVREELGALGVMGSAEFRAVAVFGLAITGWLAPAFMRLALGDGHVVTEVARDWLSVSNVAVACATLVLVLPAGTGSYQPILGLRRAAKIDWGTLVLLGGGLSLGTLIFESGLASALGNAVLGIAPPGPWFGLALLGLAATLVLYMTELTSNTATTTMMLPVLIPIAVRAELDPVPVTLTVTLAASFAFMLPVSTPPNAIAYGTGRIRISSMIRFGAWLDVLCLVLLLLAGIFFIPLFGFASTP